MSFLVAVLLRTMCLNWLSAIFPGHPLSLCRGRTSKVSSTADIVFTGTWGDLPPSDSWQQCHLWGVMSLSGALSSLVLSPHLLLYLWCSCLWSHFPYVPLFTCVWMWDAVSPPGVFPSVDDSGWFLWTSLWSSLCSYSSLGWKEVLSFIKDAGKPYA